ncbi:DUF5681 domain-containing protein [Sphingosinicella rhizophila]|uniref:DUF5681 domain-containing protein n=1 Tax=Sphingosinicella rhizophila TaxID=3050082 RepID=A0ABU3QCF8_9SPHN|nr:DUF5681 domain-containing protein [Sphingosinicella sp. GR2756]MDT9601080.1 DUF5681 domain-containing protein [Sphingosinicella sp. GR2756]
MSSRGGRPPAEHRFTKGTSGNPKGRPRKQVTKTVSAFDVVLDRSFAITQNGVPRELSVEEALQQRTYQDAIAGNRPARREILKMIAKREKWLADKAPKRHQNVAFQSEPTDPRNADEALKILGIATTNEKWTDHAKYEHLLLEPWAVQKALSRRGFKSIKAKEVGEIKRCTRDAQSLAWPKSLRDE